MSARTRDHLRSIGYTLLVAGTLFGLWQSWKTSVAMREGASRVQAAADARVAEANARAAAVELKEKAFNDVVMSEKIARIVVTPEGEITGFSAGAEALTNIPATEAIGRTLGSLGILEGGIAAELEAPPAGKTLRKESLPLHRRDKKPIDVEARATDIGEGLGAIISFDRSRSVVDIPSAPAESSQPTDAPQ